MDSRSQSIRIYINWRVPDPPYMLREVQIYYTAIHENDPSTSNKWIGSTILVHWNSKNANNDFVLCKSVANNYPDIGCPLPFFHLVTGRTLGPLNENLEVNGVFERAKKAE